MYVYHFKALNAIPVMSYTNILILIDFLAKKVKNVLFAACHARSK